MVDDEGEDFKGFDGRRRHMARLKVDYIEYLGKSVRFVSRVK